MAIDIPGLNQQQQTGVPQIAYNPAFDQLTNPGAPAGVSPLTQFADQIATQRQGAPAVPRQASPDQIARLRAAAGAQSNPIDPNVSGAPFSPTQLAQAAQQGAMRYVPGRERITQADVEKKKALNQGNFVATQGSESVTGASPLAYEDLDKIANDRREAIMNQSIADKLQVNANLDTAKTNAITAEQEHERAVAEQTDREQAWQDKYQAFQQKYDPAKDKVDPGRFFKNAGVLGSALAIIGAGFEASAAARRGTSNPQTVMRLIDNDIRAQEADIRSRGQQSNNQLMQLSREWGSVENGKIALKALQLNAIGQRAADVAARTNAPAMREHIDAQAQGALSEAGEHMAQLKAKYGGQVNEQRDGIIMRPQAGSAGGYVTDRGKQFSNMIAANKSVADQQETAAKMREAGGKQGEKAQEHAQQAAKDIAAIETVEGASTRYYQSLGLQRDKEGKWYQPATADNPLRGAWDQSAGRWSDQAREATAHRDIAAEALGRLQSQGAINDKELENFQTYLSSGGDAAERANAMQAMLRDKASGIRAGAGTAGSQQYNRALAAEGDSYRARVTGYEQPYQGRAR